jgi:integrase
MTAGYLKKDLEPGLHWDATQRGLALKVQPSGRRAWKFIYSIHNRVRWFHLGDCHAVSLAEARKQANKKRGQVDEGKDPQAEKRVLQGTKFEQLAHRYVDEYAKPNLRSWEPTNRLVERNLLKPLGKRPAGAITREEIKRALAEIKSPSVRNQTLAAASAIFSWALKENIGGITLHPCKGVERHPTESRERVLFDSEVPRFWRSFQQIGPTGTALKLILLTGQRPGEVSHMRAEHIRDGWWDMPGQPEETLGWPGTKNGESHRVWLSAPAQAVLADLPRTGFIFAEGNATPKLRLPDVMRKICDELEITDRVTPHDLRRTFGTKVTGLGFGRPAMDRILNHRDGGVGSIYDRYGYVEEDKRIMEAVAAHLTNLAPEPLQRLSLSVPPTPTPGPMERTL